MNVVMWAPVASAVVAAAGAGGSLFGFLRARGERKEAARQAAIATESAATVAVATKQLAELRTEQDQRQRARETAAERDPWSISPIDDTHAELLNNTDTPKHGINVKVYSGSRDPYNLFSDDSIPFIGPRRSARIGYVALWSGVEAVITWHFLEDCSDEQPPQIITW
jgi:hypothetical protein